MTIKEEERQQRTERQNSSVLQEKESARFGISAFTLKMIAAVTMLIDHATYLFVRDVNTYYIGRGVGRLAFPIFCFLIVEGFFHTRSVAKYALRIAAAGVVSEVAFDLTFYGTWYEPTHQNVMWTLLIGLLAIWASEQLQQIPWKIVRLPVKIVFMVAGAAFAEFLNTDYAGLGVVIIFSFYLFRGKPVFLSIAMLLENLWSSMIQGIAALAMVPIGFYNGKRGPGKYRYWFYLFYPGHLILLYLIYHFIH